LTLDAQGDANAVFVFQIASKVRLELCFFHRVKPVFDRLVPLAEMVKLVASKVFAVLAGCARTLLGQPSIDERLSGPPFFQSPTVLTVTAVRKLAFSVRQLRDLQTVNSAGTENDPVTDVGLFPYGFSIHYAQWRCISSSGRGGPLCRSVHIIGVQPAAHAFGTPTEMLGFHYIGLTLQTGNSRVFPIGTVLKSLNGIFGTVASPGR